MIYCDYVEWIMWDVLSVSIVIVLVAYATVIAYSFEHFSSLMRQQGDLIYRIIEQNQHKLDMAKLDLGFDITGNEILQPTVGEEE